MKAVRIGAGLMLVVLSVAIGIPSAIGGTRTLSVVTRNVAVGYAALLPKDADGTQYFAHFLAYETPAGDRNLLIRVCSTLSVRNLLQSVYVASECTDYEKALTAAEFYVQRPPDVDAYIKTTVDGLGEVDLFLFATHFNHGASTKVVGPEIRGGWTVEAAVIGGCSGGGRLGRWDVYAGGLIASDTFSTLTPFAHVNWAML
ncbi:MAG: hypothetical protein ABIS18_01460 [Actinomycetota bacterium]